MAKAVTRVETEADLLIQQAVDTLVGRWGGSTKLAGESLDGGPFSELQTDRRRLLRIFVRRAVLARQRGSIISTTRATNVLGGTAAL